MVPLDRDIRNTKVYMGKSYNSVFERISSHRWGYRIFKRCFDFTTSLLALIVLFPVFIVVALLIFIDDPHGSPFFIQTRVGKDGKEFRMYKFRSMVCNAEELLEDLQFQNEKDGPVFKMKKDPRITRIGHFIRKTSIDELPQLINIVKGDMSIVGPRPALPKEVAKYNKFHSRRLQVRPGLTCYWQASDNRDDISFEEWMKLDVKYIHERTTWVDIKLIFRTVRVVLTGQGN